VGCYGFRGVSRLFLLAFDDERLIRARSFYAAYTALDVRLGRLLEEKENAREVVGGHV